MWSHFRVALTAYRAAWRARIHAHDAYANQAHEADAFALGGSVAEALGGTPGLEETREAFARKLEELDGLMEDARKARDILAAQLAPAPKAKTPPPVPQRPFQQNLREEDAPRI